VISGSKPVARKKPRKTDRATDLARKSTYARTMTPMTTSVALA
jgi:hypothetical protein